MVLPPRTAAFSPSPAQALQTGSSTGHTHTSSQAAALSAAASPSTGSPTGSSSLTNIVVTQVYVLLGSIKDENDPKFKQLRKLIDDHGMEVFSRYFTRLVAGSASQIFPGHNRQVANPTNYQLLKAEIHKISHDADQARKVAEALDTGTEDVFRDFDLSTFMEHFKMDALEKTLLALHIKSGTRSDLKTKGRRMLTA